MVCGVKSTDVPFLMPSVRFNRILKHSDSTKINGILIKRYRISHYIGSNI